MIALLQGSLCKLIFITKCVWTVEHMLKKEKFGSISWSSRADWCMTSENLAADEKCAARFVNPQILCSIMFHFFLDNKRTFHSYIGRSIRARDKLEFKGSSAELATVVQSLLKALKIPCGDFYPYQVHSTVNVQKMLLMITNANNMLKKIFISR